MKRETKLNIWVTIGIVAATIWLITTLIILERMKTQPGVKMYLTDYEAELLQASGLPRDTPYVIQDVSRGMFSVSRHYGGAPFNGSHYTYNPKTDELIRDDVLKWVERNRVGEK